MFKAQKSVVILQVVHPGKEFVGVRSFDQSLPLISLGKGSIFHRSNDVPPSSKLIANTELARILQLAQFHLVHVFKDFG